MFERDHGNEISPIVQPHQSTWKSRLQSHWLSAQEIKPALLSALKVWSKQRGNEQSVQLSAIRHEIWLADCALQPLPMVATAFADEAVPLGFLCGYPRYHHRCFHICEIALYPRVPDLSEAGLAIAAVLLEAAIDESQRMGCHGWVACAASESRQQFWRSLGFFRYDNITYRRMGYF